MAKSSRKAASRQSPKPGASTSRASKPAGRGAAAAAPASPRAGAARTKGASRWSRGKPASARKVASARPTRIAPAPLAIRDPSQEEIAHHAYLRWCAHGGSEHENWFAAEQELRTRRNALRVRRSAKGGSS